MVVVVVVVVLSDMIKILIVGGGGLNRLPAGQPAEHRDAAFSCHLASQGQGN